MVYALAWRREAGPDSMPSIGWFKQTYFSWRGVSGPSLAAPILRLGVATSVDEINKFPIGDRTGIDQKWLELNQVSRAVIIKRPDVLIAPHPERSAFNAQRFIGWARRV